jgi:ribose transport system substrate-binding protein
VLRTKAAIAAVLIPVLISAAAVGSAQSSAPPATDAAASGSDSAPGGSDAATAAAEAGGQPSVAVAAEAEPGSGEGLTIGYLSNLEAVPIVHVISEGIREQADRAGVNLIFCDGAGDNATALNCMKLFKDQGAQGILNFQHDTQAAPSICAAGPQGVPVFAIDIPQPPCQTSFMGVDNSYGGRIAGEVLGQYFADNFDCDYDAWVSLEQPIIGQPNEDRMGGYREGFAEKCGEVHDLRQVAFDASTEDARTKMADTLTALPNAERIIVTSIDDEGIVGAFAAADVAGRSDQLYAASLGMADDTMRCGLQTNPNWVVSTAIFPERYGWVGIPYMIDAINGEDVPENLFVPLVAVTGDTIGDYYDLSC